MPRKSINRNDFISAFMRSCGVTFSQACLLFDTMVSVFQDGMVNGAKIRIGRLGALDPVRHEPKTVHMSFRRTKEGLVRQRHVYFLDQRIAYKVQIYRRFINTHNLHWYSEHWPVDDEMQAEADADQGNKP